MRQVHRTLVARIFASVLLLLAASPITAPFTTIELSDFTHQQHHPASAHYPGHEAAVPRAKIVVQSLAAPEALVIVRAPASVEDRRTSHLVTAHLQARAALQAVIRV